MNDFSDKSLSWSKEKILQTNKERLKTTVDQRQNRTEIV